MKSNGKKEGMDGRRSRIDFEKEEISEMMEGNDRKNKRSDTTKSNKIKKIKVDLEK